MSVLDRSLVPQISFDLRKKLYPKAIPWSIAGATDPPSTFGNIRQSVALRLTGFMPGAYEPKE